MALLGAAMACIAVPKAGAAAGIRVTPLMGSAPHSTALSLLHDDESSNWAGIADTGIAFTSIGATWQVPAVSAPIDGTAYSSTWVGIGGDSDNDSTLIQAGTEQDAASGGQTQYYAWYELLPADSIAIDEPVDPGDEITVSIVETSPAGQLWTITVTDATQSWTFSKSFRYASKNASAEWIEEAPTIGQRQSSMADFGTVSFDSLVVNGLSLLAPSGASPDRIDFVNSKGIVLAYPDGYDAETNQLTIVYGTPAVLRVRTALLPEARVGATYTATLVASGGIPAYSWTTMGALPRGLTLDGSTGVIAGLPVTSGTSTLTVVVHDASGAAARASLTVEVTAARFELIQATPHPATVRAGSGFAARLTVTASGSVTGPITFTKTRGSAAIDVSPTGKVAMSSTTGYGSYEAFGTDTDTFGDAGTWTVAVTVIRPTHVVIATPTLAIAVVGRRYRAALIAFAPSGALSWSLAGRSRLPDGLTLSRGGVISGRPTASAAGTVGLVLHVTAGTKGATSRRLLSVDVLPKFVPTSVVEAAPGSQLSVPIAATGRPVPTITAVEATLPAWLSISVPTAGNATLGGTVPVDATGSLDVTLVASNAAGSVDTDVIIEVQAPSS